MGAFLGIFLHAVGGLAAGSFYIPLKQVRGWAWETGWLVNGVSAWILVPFIVALLTVPGTMEVLGLALTTEASAAGYTFLFGLLWGIGGLTFGLSIRYLGVALGTTIALGFCAAFGTLLPPIVKGQLLAAFAGTSGLLVLLGLVVCFGGIALAGVAGRRREVQQSDSGGAAAGGKGNAERQFGKGLLVAAISGMLSACFAFGLAAGGPIQQLTVARGTVPLFQSSAVYVILLWGGFLTNAVYCVFMHVRNRTAGDYTADTGRQGANYGWAALAGAIWYLQFMFYGMGSSFLGPAYDFASWSIHMAFIIFFSNAWGLYYREWSSVRSSTLRLLYGALGVLLVSVVLIGLGSSE